MRQVRSCKKIQLDGEALSLEMMDQEPNVETFDALRLDGNVQF